MYELRGRCYGMVRNYEAALADFNKAMQLFQEKDLIYYNRGVTYERMGLIENAIENYQKAVEFNKNHVDALERLKLLGIEG